jgi:DNA polymerase bacteriophage-type
MIKAHLDFETRSAADLKTAGAYRYAEHDSTGIWCFSYQVGSGDVKCWSEGDPEPTELTDHIRNGGVVVSHNASFERNIWNKVLLRTYPTWPALTIQQQECTMARAAAVSHPQSLDTLCQVLNLDQTKDMKGYATMMKLSKPRGVDVAGNPTWWADSSNLEVLKNYCIQDTKVEIEVDNFIPPLTEYERKVWELDQIINDRGIQLDIDSAYYISKLVEELERNAHRKMRSLTGYAVPKCSSDAKLISWLNSKGVDCDTVKKGVQDDLLKAADAMQDANIRAVIELRANSKKTSTAKYAAMVACVCKDGRARGLLNYHGAGPGRWAGRLLQPQNFPRLDYGKEGMVIEALLGLVARKEKPDLLLDCMSLLFGDQGRMSPLEILSRALRSMIIARDGFTLVGGDFSNIEGRINAWFADETWKLKAFSDYDKGEGPDLYNLAYARSFGVPVESVTKDQRQLGKVQELALGYQGGVNAFISMGAAYKLDPKALADAVKRTTHKAEWDNTAAVYESAKDKSGLEKEEWTAIKIVVNSWRAANPKIVQSWWDLQDAAVQAVAAPFTAVSVLGGRASYYSDTKCLWCVLPSGRMICYANPSIAEEVQECVSKTGEIYFRKRRVVKFYGYKEGQWKRLALYGGLQCENIVQGTARCVMVDRMFAAEEAGYPLVLTVHDELLAEVPLSRYDLDASNLERIMSEVPKFITGLPLAAKAWQDKRYIK